jgi:LCP family protein required for cell wall assembly
VSTSYPRDSEPQHPLPPRLDPRAGRGNRAVGDAPRGRRSGLAVTGRVLGAVVSVVLLATSGWGWYLGRVAEASVKRTDAIPTNGNKDTSGHGSDMNLLLVGADSRDGITSVAQQKALAAFSDGGSMNTDTMILVHVPADGSKASFVSLPRDSYVPIPGHGSDRLNAAYAYGYNAAPSSASESDRQSAGQQLLVQTVSQLSGLQIDHFASVNLLGFYNLSNVVGGVQVNLCKAVNDPWSGAVFPAGLQTITGADALKFVRQRHGLDGGDLDREKRQQVFIGAVARKMLSDNVLLNPSKQQELVKAVAQSLTVDRSLDLLQLAQQMQKVTAGGVTFQTMPIAGDMTTAAGAAVLKVPDPTTLHAFFAQLSAIPASSSFASSGPGAAATTSAAPQTVAPSKVKVQVFNGSGTPGLAANAGAALQTAGFTVAGTGNADAATYTKTEVRYAAGNENLAATVAAKFPGATTTVRSDATSGTVQVVLGSDFTAVGQPLKVAATTAAATPTDTPRTAADTTCIN